jgi:hypothetical protein
MDNMKYFSNLKWQLLLFISLGIMAIFISASSLSIFVNADNLNPGVYSKDSKPYGIPYGEWIAKFNQWFIQIPNAVNPREHYTPEVCNTAQSGPVWFLADILKGKADRTCTIPAGKAILLPTLSGICWDDKTNPTQSTEQGLTDCAKAGNEYGLISATLDGKKIQNLESYRAQSPFFNITVPKDNVFNNVPGIWKAKGDGFFVFLEPLPPGMHTLHTTVSVINPKQPTYNYASDLTYHLMVKP